jgi:hypothetical protein
MEKFDEIQVHKLTVVGPDGTPRFVLANEERVPAAVVDGQEIVNRKGPAAPAFLFYNQRGDECGGLLAHGELVDGSVDAGSGLMFDQFRNDQVLGLVYSESNGRRSYGLAGWDRGDRPFTDFIERQRIIEALDDQEVRERQQRELYEDFSAAQRFFFGRTSIGEATVLLADSKGRPRLRLVVGDDDDPRIEFLNSDGQVTYRIPPAIDRFDLDDA